MTSQFEQAELLTALWKLGAGSTRLPTSHGILDRALKECLGELPSALADNLSFGITGVGLRCYELPAILLAAQEALITSEPNPTYFSSVVTLDDDAARQIVVGFGISTRRASEIGKCLKQAVDEIRAQTTTVSDQLSAA